MDRPNFDSIIGALNLIELPAPNNPHPILLDSKKGKSTSSKKALMKAVMGSSANLENLSSQSVNDLSSDSSSSVHVSVNLSEKSLEKSNEDDSKLTSSSRDKFGNHYDSI